VREETTTALDNQVRDATDALNYRFQIYINGLRSSRALFVALGDIGYRRWEEYVGALDLHAQYPGINGTGFIRHVPAKEKEAYEQRVRELIGPVEPAYAQFTIKRPSGALPDVDEYLFIEYLQPLQKNIQAIGLDLGFEPVRRAALERARDTGEAASSGRIILVQDAEKVSGIIVALPIYHRNAPRGDGRGEAPRPVRVHLRPAPHQRRH
jgi:CHASE1-domain containing sensor protein